MSTIVHNIRHVGKLYSHLLLGLLFAKTNGISSGKMDQIPWHDSRNIGFEELPSVVPNPSSVTDSRKGGDWSHDTRCYSTCQVCSADTTVTLTLYHQLPSQEWFRLLIIEAASFDEPIKCQLICALRSEMVLEYETLSYSWAELA